VRNPKLERTKTGEGQPKIANTMLQESLGHPQVDGQSQGSDSVIKQMREIDSSMQPDSNTARQFRNDGQAYVSTYGLQPVLGGNTGSTKSLKDTERI